MQNLPKSVQECHAHHYVFWVEGLHSLQELKLKLLIGQAVYEFKGVLAWTTSLSHHHRNPWPVVVYPVGLTLYDPSTAA